MDKNIGKRLDGRYEITELIGIGGMADVYKAVDILEDKTVAVKILKPEFSDNEEFIRRFRNESKAIAILSHPNIVKIFDVGFTDKMQFIVMEYIDGITLKEFIEQQGVLKWKDTVHFIIQILRALQHAHDRGIVHRDIKPQNIMLFPDGTIKVMDFGIARFAREELKTISDKAIGSVHYISPEQASGNVTDERSDIYSVGIMMYEMLTGVKPFDADNPLTVILMHMQKGAKPPRKINDSIPEGLEEIVMRAMQADPSKRYQSASEMIKDIEEFKRNPAINFSYDYTSTQTLSFGDKEKEAAKVAFEETVNAEKPRIKVREKVKQEAKKAPKFDDDDEDETTVSSSSYFVVILTAIAATIVIIVIAFIALKLVDVFNPAEATTEAMPDLVGFSFLDVKQTYQDKFTLTVAGEEYSDEYPEGAIIKQSYEADKDYHVGSCNQEVVVSRGKRKVIIDNVYGNMAQSAEAILKSSGFKVQFLYQNDETIEKDMVIKTDPPRNESVDAGSVVWVYLSNGPAVSRFIMPDVVGQTLETASTLLSKLTVTIEYVDSIEPEGTVIAQSLPPLDDNGEPLIVNIKTPVTIQVSTGEEPEKSVEITFSVPNGITKSAQATFRSYVNGDFKDEVSRDNIKYTTTVTIPVSGSGIQRVTIEGVNKTTSQKVDIAEYEVNFDLGTATQISFNNNAFLTLFGADTVVTTLPPINNDDDYIDPGDDWWNEIFGE
ncbi:MAG: Stk1 family PASTA domain-containing Ser/Thr kinase [Ruminococcus sp.]|jgi:serine/threonine-protein kinase|nr:Stk1 family PASTA domain-containing Ser/Thr kinase [Ruminococcus sp.]